MSQVSIQSFKLKNSFENMMKNCDQKFEGQLYTIKNKGIKSDRQTLDKNIYPYVSAILKALTQ